MTHRESPGWVLATLCASFAFLSGEAKLNEGDASLLGMGKGVAMPRENASETMVKLNDGVFMPLIGMGVGNLQQQFTAEAIVRGVQKNGVRVVDTAHQSGNEMLVAGAIRKAMANDESDTVVDVVTKVWYTYLGTNRTRMSVKASLEEMGLKEAASVVDAAMNGKRRAAGKPGKQDILRVTMLLHWPRCYDDVPWMRCEQEEAELPAEVRVAGPPAYLRPNESWKESWRVLEDLYKKGALASIGVSNFDLEDLKELVGMAEIKPHLLQVSLFQYLTNKAFRQFVSKQQIPVQVFSAMFAVLNPEKLAHAAGPREVLEQIGQEKLGGVDVGTVLMKWLAQQKVMQIPKASSTQHLDMNAPDKILKLPSLSKEDMVAVEDAVIEIMQAKPPPPQAAQSQGVEARFQNSLDRTLALYWINTDNGEELPLSELPPGTHLDEMSHAGHSFVARFTGPRQDGDKDFRFQIPADSRPGMQHTFNVHREL